MSKSENKGKKDERYGMKKKKSCTYVRYLTLSCSAFLYFTPMNEGFNRNSKQPRNNEIKEMHSCI